MHGSDGGCQARCPQISPRASDRVDRHQQLARLMSGSMEIRIRDPVGKVQEVMGLSHTDYDYLKVFKI